MASNAFCVSNERSRKWCANQARWPPHRASSANPTSVTIRWLVAHALAETARDAIRQLHAWNADSPPEQEDASDITLALETDQNFPEPTLEGILPLRAAVGRGGTQRSLT